MPDTSSEKRPLPAEKTPEILPGTVLTPATSGGSTGGDPEESQLPEEPPGGGETPGEDLE